MAFQTIMVLTGPEGTNQYIIQFNPDTTTFDVSTSDGSTPVDFYDWGVEEGTYISYLCSGFDKYVFRTSHTYPFAYYDFVPNAADCGYTPPQDPTDPPGNDPVQDPYGLIYQIQFDNAEGNRVIANIYDTTVRSQTLTVIPLADNRGRVPADAVIIKTVNNDEDKFTPIRAKSVEMRFFSSNEYNLNTFIGGKDNRFYVEILLSDEVIFKGFLVQDELQEDFMPHPHIVRLTATDNLALLKDVPLVTPTGNNPRGVNKFVDYILFALKKTGLDLDLIVLHNLRQAIATTEPAWWSTSLFAKTFEKTIGESVDCYTALEMLLMEDCFLTQWKGKWLIVRIDELDGRTQYFTEFKKDGTTFTLATGADPLVKAITPLVNDGSEQINFINNSQIVKPTRPLREVKEIHYYEYPLELIDNIDFSRGDLVPINAGPNALGFELEDWTMFAGFGYSSNTITANAYLKKVYDEFGNEIERYVVITPQADNLSSNTNFLQSNGAPLNKYDKFSVSIDYRFETEVTNFATNAFVMTVRLIGSGAYYWLGWNENKTGYKWWPTTATFGDFSIFAMTALDFNQPGSDKDWKTLRWDAPPLPVDGDIYITIHSMNNEEDSTKDNVVINYANLQFDYRPYIAGSYTNYIGHYHKISQDAEYKGRREKEIKITENPRFLFKGCLLYFNTAVNLYKPIGVGSVSFYDYSVHPITSSIPVDAFRDWGWWQAYSVWNQFKRENRIFDADLIGLGTDLPDLIHQYRISEATPHTTNKTFMLLHHTQNLHTCQWQGVFIETFDTQSPKTYVDTYLFNYLLNKS